MERDCSDEVEFRDGKANPFGWSSAQLWHNGEQIGFHDCGTVTIKHPDYRYTIISEGYNRRLCIFCKIADEVYA